VSKTISNISKLTDLKTALKKCGLKNGDTLSFHHQLRNGDSVLNLTLEAVKEVGVKNIRLAQTALFNVHKPVIDYIKDGIVSRIEGSINGVVGDYVSKHPLQNPVILRSHGRRWADVKTDELHVDIAVIGASSSDEQGNCTGITGKNAFGPIIYSQIDAMNAEHVIVVTDNIVEYPCTYQEITEGFVDYVAVVDNIGNPENIVSGSTKITDDPMKRQIAHDCISLMDAAGIIKNGMSFQAGAGGISLAATKYLGEKLKEKNITASFGMGGLTKYLVDIYNTGGAKKLYYAQCFDTEAVKFVSENPGMPIMDIGHYADPTSKSRTVDSLDTVVLGATEVDTKFNVNVNTHSDGRLLHGIGGHQDTAAGAKLTIITVPLYRKKNPIVREKVTTITTPGSVVDAVVTNEGTAINPKRKDLLEKVKGKINPVSLEGLKDMAYARAGKPEPLELDDEIVAEIRWIDGSVLDRVYRVKEN
jgi:citrate lyase subunit alpha/citrate CoA-transferase